MLNDYDKKFKKALALITEYNALWKVEDRTEKPLQRPEFAFWRRTLQLREAESRGPWGDILRIIVKKCNTSYYSRNGRDFYQSVGHYDHRNKKNDKRPSQRLRSLSIEEFETWDAPDRVKAYFSKVRVHTYKWGTYVREVYRMVPTIPDYMTVFKYEKVYYTHYYEKDGSIDGRRSELYREIAAIDGWTLVYGGDRYEDDYLSRKKKILDKLALKDVEIEINEI